MRLKQVMVLILALSFTPALTGCWGYKEFEHQFYPHAIALDKVNGQYVIYVQVLDMSKLGRTESGTATQGPGAWIGKAEGATVDEAAHKLYQVTPRSMNWGHVNAFLLTENILKDSSWTNVLGIFTRYQQFRYTSWIFSTKDDVQSILQRDPVIEKSPVYSGLGDPIELYHESSFIRPIRLNTFIATMREPASPHLIPEVSIRKGYWFESGMDRSAMALTGYTALDHQRQFAGSISKEACTGLRWTDAKLKRTSLNLIQNGKPIGAALLQKPHYQIRFKKYGTGVRYQLDVSIRGKVAEKYAQRSLAALDKIAAAEIKREILQTYRNGIQKNIDIFGLQESLYRKNPRLYHAMQSDGTLSLTSTSLSQVKVRVQLLTGIRTLEGPRGLTED